MGTHSHHPLPSDAATEIKSVKAFTALTILLMLTGYLVGYLANWDPDPFAQGSAVLFALAGLLWITHSLSDKTAKALDSILSGHNGRIIEFISIACFVISLLSWFGAAFLFWQTLEDFARSKGTWAVAVVSIGRQLAILLTAVGIFFYALRQIRSAPRGLTVALLWAAAKVLKLFSEDGKKDGAKKMSDEELVAGALLLMPVTASVVIVYFFPATIAAIAVNLILARVLRAGWWILSSPVSAGDAIREAAGGSSVTLGVVFVLTGAGTMALGLSLMLKAGAIETVTSALF